uniref:Uncharacterized protein n=1 Tax=Caldiarchaeum subterraneum TaxID=311458 RepID=A0A7C5YG35_CALS0
MAETAIIPPPNVIPLLFFGALAACVVILHLLLIIIGSRKLSIQPSIAPVLQPAPRNLTSPRSTTVPTKTEPTPPTPSKSVEDFPKRLEKIDELLNTLETMVKAKQENTKHPEAETIIQTESQQETDISEIVRLAKSLKREI